MADVTAQRTGGQEVAAQVALVRLKAYPDGSFDMTPGFCKEGSPAYRFEDGNGMMLP